MMIWWEWTSPNPMHDVSFQLHTWHIPVYHPSAPTDLKWLQVPTGIPNSDLFVVITDYKFTGQGLPNITVYNVLETPNDKGQENY